MPAEEPARQPGSKPITIDNAGQARPLFSARTGRRLRSRGRFSNKQRNLRMSTSVSAGLNRSTPGVYINELPAFGTAIVGVSTAVPIFIGYTEVAGGPATGKPLYNTAVPISSMKEFIQYFGGPAPARYEVVELGHPQHPSGHASGASDNNAPAVQPPASFSAAFADESGNISTRPFVLQPHKPPNKPGQFNLYWSMQAFFANGGGDCFVVSVGSYWLNEFPTPASLSTPVPGSWMAGTIEPGDPNGDAHSGQSGLNVGLAVAGDTTGPTMIVVPEACQLCGPDYASIACNMLLQASRMQDRMAILDLPGALSADTWQALQAAQTALSDAIAPQVSSASYGACYGPALRTSIISVDDILYTALQAPDGDNRTLNKLLTAQAATLYGGDPNVLGQVRSAIAAAFPVPASASGKSHSTSGNYSPAPADGAALKPWMASLDQQLLDTLPVFRQIKQLVVDHMNTLPPSGLLAGIWTTSDKLNGVWNAPANMALASVVAPLCDLTDAQQGGFNVPANGEAINIVRAQPSRGSVVWGARTLDGNSNDYRYIQVRRTLIYIEQSIKLALQNYVFAPNDATTWSAVTAAIGSFLTGVWQQGGLMGDKPGDAFSVACGLGSSMTAQNVLDGYMVVTVLLQLTGHDEFMELAFTQTMGS